MEVSKEVSTVVVGLLLANAGGIIGSFIWLIVQTSILREKVGRIEKDVNNLAKMIKQRKEV